jgi:structural maintenance of chromosome 2
MGDSVEKREDDLKRMLATVMKDKEKIEETIEELDRYKRDALQKTWEKVNWYGVWFSRPETYVDDVCG